jgi:hypothetical protein
VLFAGMTVAITAIRSNVEVPAPIRYRLPAGCVLLGAVLLLPVLLYATGYGVTKRRYR